MLSLFTLFFSLGTWADEAYFYTGSIQTFTVPAGVSNITVVMWGGGGGGGGNATGGGGGYSRGTIAVTPGERLNVTVGGGGTGRSHNAPGGWPNGGNGGSTRHGYYGAGGGGRSSISRGSTDLLVAGGGGGVGAHDTGGLYGGAGGGLIGGNAPSSPWFSTSGRGGTQSSGGSGGGSGSQSGGYHFGGSGDSFNGTGGGDGYYGGGAGDDHQGGGGGSGYINGASVWDAITSAGSAGTPGGTSDTNYITGIGIGGPTGPNGNNAAEAGPSGGSGLVMVMVAPPAARASPQAVWYESFETDDYMDRWHVEGGVWAVGRPTSGPGKAHPPSQRCAGTVLADTYPRSADARLVRDEPFLVHAAELCPRLRFWHWNNNDPLDPGTVEVRPAGGGWQPISPEYVRVSSAWTRATLDLSDFAGQSVTLAFHFKSNSDARVGPGWYVDDVEYVIGCPEWDPVGVPEQFEAGLGDWEVEGGQWEIGVPPSNRGPGRAQSGARCVGTILDGNYDPNADARLITPAFVVPSASLHPRLRFWHWNHNFPEDRCLVEIRVAGGTWLSLSRVYTHYSRVWTRTSLDLREYADQRVQFAFHLRAGADNDVASGWYVDGVQVVTGEPVLRALEDFEIGLSDWSVDGGQWQVGRPAGTLGPRGALSGVNCAGTVLDGNYEANTDSRLVSPEFEVPAATDHPRLRFWHWWNCFGEDPGQVEIRPVGGTWQPISASYVWNSQVWTRTTLDLRPYAGQCVQIGFRFKSNNDNNAAAGWYLDNVELVRGESLFNIVNNPERFSNGLGEWSVERGNWQVGTPKAGPGKALSSPACAGTVLDGNYEPRTDTRLISPEFDLPPATDLPRLRFWEWYSTYQGDYGTVQIRPVGSVWQILSPALHQLNNRAWTRASMDLVPFAGQRVQLAFAFQANSDASVAAGWYVDDIEVATGRTCFNLVNNPEGFEAGLGDWQVVPGNWQVGRPTKGPPAAFKEDYCAGTVLNGDYDTNMIARLISPPFMVPCVESVPRLRFSHWHALGTGDRAVVEIRELPEGGSSPVVGPWSSLSETYSNSSGGWISGFAELTPQAGKTVQLAFRLLANTDTSVAAGWYVDEVRIQATLGDPPQDRQVVEGEPLSFPVTTLCPNVRLRLAPDAPPGASFDPDLGLFRWWPSECDGPGTHEIRYLLFDPLQPQCPMGTLTNRIEVLELNSPPVFAETPLLAIRPGEPVDFRAADYVHDPDCPAQKLTYTLEPGSTPNAVLSKNLGLLVWNPTIEDCRRLNTLTIRATDDGLPPLSVTKTVFAGSLVLFRPPQRASDAIELTADGAQPGATYEILSSPTLPGSPGDWTRFESGKVPADGVVTVRVPLGNEPARFYRCLVLP